MLFTPLYTVEMILKMWGFGLWRNEQSYFIDSWCRFDLLIVIASWIDVTLMVSTVLSGLLLNAHANEREGATSKNVQKRERARREDGLHTHERTRTCANLAQNYTQTQRRADNA
jgi:hypothetical protein